jgi:hypothetical protein
MVVLLVLVLLTKPLLAASCGDPAHEGSKPVTGHDFVRHGHALVDYLVCA